MECVAAVNIYSHLQNTLKLVSENIENLFFVLLSIE